MSFVSLISHQDSQLHGIIIIKEHPFLSSFLLLSQGRVQNKKLHKVGDTLTRVWSIIRRVNEKQTGRERKHTEVLIARSRTAENKRDERRGKERWRSTGGKK